MLFLALLSYCTKLVVREWVVNVDIAVRMHSVLILHLDRLHESILWAAVREQTYSLWGVCNGPKGDEEESHASQAHSMRDVVFLGVVGWACSWQLLTEKASPGWCQKRVVCSLYRGHEPACSNLYACSCKVIQHSYKWPPMANDGIWTNSYRLVCNSVGIDLFWRLHVHKMLSAKEKRPSCRFDLQDVTWM